MLMTSLFCKYPYLVFICQSILIKGRQLFYLMTLLAYYDGLLFLLLDALVLSVLLLVLCYSILVLRVSGGMLYNRILDMVCATWHY